MTQTMPDTKALKALLSEIEKQEGQWHDDLLGRYLCAVYGSPFGHTAWDTDLNPMTFIVYSRQGALVWSGTKPDVDLTAADKLVREVLPNYWRESGYGPETNDAGDNDAWARVYCVDVGMPPVTTHPTREPTAICLALARALIAKDEG